MSLANTWQQRRLRFVHRRHARRAGRAKVATAFVSAPEPRTIGIVARGQQLATGTFLFSGLLVEGQKHSIWDIANTYPTVADEIHGCAWLDDLAALGDDKARSCAQTWVLEWIDRYGDGRDAGWTPGVTGRRLIRWINHGMFLLRGQDKTAAHKFYQSLARQTLFLSRRWQVTTPGIRRFEALAGIVYAGVSLKDMAHHVAPALAALAQDCENQIDAQGAIATRNPQQLLEILSLLNWTAKSLDDADHKVPAELQSAIARIAPTLRALRHADGGLARFHGGGRGIDGQLDTALATSGVKDMPGTGTHMGFARLAAGRSTIIVDAATPPTGAHSADAHASTLGFELTSGRRPLIVNCGSGARFGEDWRRASRATPSHSTMMIEGVSSSHLEATKKLLGHDELLTYVPTLIQCDMGSISAGRQLELSQNGYQPSHGLTHARVLQLSVDGRTLNGEDLLTTLSRADEAICSKAQAIAGIPYVVRFHLHPDVEADFSTDDAAIILTLKSGEVWAFQHDGAAQLGLAPSVYLQNGALKPIPTQQVVLSGRAMAYATRVRWSLAKTQDTPNAVRDFAHADPLDPID